MESLHWLRLLQHKSIPTHLTNSHQPPGGYHHDSKLGIHLFSFHLPVISCPPPGSHQCPIASYAFSPPCFAYCFALAPRHFLFHLPCLDNSYAQHRRSSSRTFSGGASHFLSFVCFPKPYIMKPQSPLHLSGSLLRHGAPRVALVVKSPPTTAGD